MAADYRLANVVQESCAHIRGHRAKGQITLFLHEVTKQLEAATASSPIRVQKFDIFSDAYTPQGDYVPKKKYSFVVEVYLKGLSHLHAGGVLSQDSGVAVFFKSENFFSIRALKSVYLVDKNNAPAFSKTSASVCNFPIYGTRRGFHNAFPISALKKDAERFFPGDTLQIVCSLELLLHDRVSREKSAVRLNIHGQAQSQVVQDFHSFFSQTADNHSDIALEVEGSEPTFFKCHKFVLASRSPVFRAMFKAHDGSGTTVEGCSSRWNEGHEAGPLGAVVNVGKFEKDAVEAFVNFMYSDKLPAGLPYDILLDIFVMADKYDIPRLASVSEKAISELISVENICAIYPVMELHRAPYAKKTIRTYFRDHYAAIKCTSAWGSFKNEHPTMAAALLQSIVDLYM